MRCYNVTNRASSTGPTNNGGYMTPALEAAQKSAAAAVTDICGETDSQNGQPCIITVRRRSAGELLPPEIFNHALEAAARKLKELRAQRTHG